MRKPLPQLHDWAELLQSDASLRTTFLAMIAQAERESKQVTLRSPTARRFHSYKAKPCTLTIVPLSAK